MSKNGHQSRGGRKEKIICLLGESILLLGKKGPSNRVLSSLSRRRGFLRPRGPSRRIGSRTDAKNDAMPTLLKARFGGRVCDRARARGRFFFRGRRSLSNAGDETTYLFPRLLVPSLGTRANPSSQPRLSADYPRYPGLRSSTRTPCSSLGTSRAELKAILV